MSHTVKRKTSCTNADIIKRAAEAMKGASFLGQGKHKTFSGTNTGIGVKLPGWTAPITFDNTGEVVFDNYEGRWGKPEVIDEFVQRYAVEQGKDQLEKEGYENIQEELLPNGDIKCTVSIGGDYGVAGAGGAEAGPVGGGGYDVAGPDS
jgi:hypothetical protein